MDAGLIANQMLNGFMSSWSWPAGSVGAHDTGLREEVSSDRLPSIHFYRGVMTAVRRALLLDSGASRNRVGVFRGFRSCAPEDHVLFDDVLPQSESALIRPGAVVVTVGTGAALCRPWREGRVGGDGSLLKLFGAIATPQLLDDGRGVSVCVQVNLPNFQLTRWTPLQGFDAPTVAEVSLGIVLRGGDTLREGEHVGFLVQNGKSSSNSVEPVLLSDDVGSRAIVGMWTLSERDVWSAAAVFAADSMTRRNAKVARPVGRVPVRRTVQFLVAQFREHAGGDPVFVPCSVTLPALNERQHISFSAQLSSYHDDEESFRDEIISAHFAEDSLGGLSHQEPSSLQSELGGSGDFSPNSSQVPVHESHGSFDAARRVASGEETCAGLDAEVGDGSHEERAQSSAGNRSGQFEGSEKSHLEQARTQQRNVNRRLDALNADLNASSRHQSPSEALLSASDPQTNPSGFRSELIAQTTSGSSGEDDDLLRPGFSTRLDALARKYLGEQYRSEFGID